MRYVDEAQYHEHLKQFTDLVAADQSVRVGQEGVVSVTCYVETGRKLDKVIVAEHRKGSARTKLSVRYFVDKKDGEIYGAKSDAAPNLRWYFGNLRTVQMWNWSGFHGIPLDERQAGVVLVGKYGDYNHYQKRPFRIAKVA